MAQSYIKTFIPYGEFMSFATGKYNQEICFKSMSVMIIRNIAVEMRIVK